jgi:hypothetical protein
VTHGNVAASAWHREKLGPINDLWVTKDRATASQFDAHVF